jgi:hypothetical protein
MVLRDLTLSPEIIAEHFAQDFSPEGTKMIAVTQGANVGIHYALVSVP